VKEEKPKEKVVVAMSGGVDSSVAAILLLEQGYEVIGVMLRLWKGEGAFLENECCTPDSISMARNVARKLGIPFFVLDAEDEFKKKVVDYFLESHRSGETPNPCVVCNQVIRWGFLRNRAELMGASFFATGHYARIVSENNHLFLKKGSDLAKDQSYVLSRLTSEDLCRTILPLGTWRKNDVRRKAAEVGLAVSEKPDSQDLCFVGGDIADFLKRYAPDTYKPGDIVDEKGNVLGKHEGLAFYTIGQRKGLKIAWSEPLFVIGKDISRNRLIVAPHDHIQTRVFTINQTNWFVEPGCEEYQGEVMIRYRSTLFPAKIIVQKNDLSARIETDDMIGIPTPGQLAVIYQGDIVLGSGFITEN